MDNFIPTFNEISSGRVHDSNVVVSFDKLIFSTYPLDRQSLVDRAKPAMRGDGHVIQNLPKGREATLFFADSFDGGLRFSLNPSFFTTIWDCLDAIKSVLGQQGLRAKVKRIDIAVTFPCDFRSVYMGLDFGFSRSISHVGFEGKGETVYIGKIGKRWRIKIYDKTKEMKANAKKKGRTINYPCTRIEITWRPENEMKIEELCQMLEVEPFNDLTAHHFRFVEPPVSARGQVWRNFYEFEQLCMRWGYWHARKKLNKKYRRNFAKKFGSFFDLSEMKPTLDEIYLQGIRGFFQQ